MQGADCTPPSQSNETLANAYRKLVLSHTHRSIDCYAGIASTPRKDSYFICLSADDFSSPHAPERAHPRVIPHDRTRIMGTPPSGGPAPRRGEEGAFTNSGYRPESAPAALSSDRHAGRGGRHELAHVESKPRRGGHEPALQRQPCGVRALPCCVLPRIQFWRRVALQHRLQVRYFPVVLRAAQDPSFVPNPVERIEIECCKDTATLAPLYHIFEHGDQTTQCAQSAHSSHPFLR